MISVLIMTRNEELNLPGCLKSVEWSDDIHVLDSFSDDRTPDIATEAGAKVTRRSFDNWSAHQNWGLSNIPFKHPWVLYIDADERVSRQLADYLQVFEGDADCAAFEIRRRDFAWNGSWLRYSQISPYFIRLFKPDKIRYERLVNPVTIVEGKVGRVEGYLDHFPFSKGIRFWIQRHLGYAELEAQIRLNEMARGTRFSLKTALFGKSFAERRRHQKGLFYRMPLRPAIKWLYMFFWRRSFLDGKAGIVYTNLQAIYEYFIVLNTRELLKK
jgi:glycosyltransferase involved in cell wall biosynthesis